MQKLRDFLSVYRFYRRCQHPRLYCARIAWDMTVHKTPFQKYFDDHITEITEFDSYD